MQLKDMKKEELVNEITKLRRIVDKLEKSDAEYAKGGNELVEKTMRQNKECYQHIFEHSPIGIGIASVDGNVIIANKTMKAITGYSMKELKKINLINTYENAEERNILNKTLKRNRCVHNYPVRLKRKDGTLYEALLSIKHLYLGGKDFYHTICQDITDRKETERELQTAHNRLKFLLSSSSAIIYTSKVSDDFGATFISENVKNLWGYHPRDFVENSNFWSDHIHPEDREHVLAGLSQVFKKGFHVHEYRFLLSNGDYHWIHDELTLVQDAKGNPKECIGCCFDITERKKAEQQIQKDLKEKEVLLREVHHRVKNNLQIVKSLLNLQAEYIQDKRNLKMFKDSQDRIQTMALVHEKLYQTKDFTRVDFADYVHSLATNLYRSFGIDSNKIRLKINAKEEISLPVHLAIPCGLIINELISNALKYAFPPWFEGKGKISVSLVQTDDGMIELIVADNGMGMPKKIDIGKPETLGL
ncbi:PAS domain S-box protein, partial [bacterium]|nr:PAS domain S-box protein [bacterium]